jgi:PPOX class probable F420-dependent enzyme
VRLTEPVMRRLVREARSARISTIDPDGRPNLVPVVFVLDGDTLLSSVDDKPKDSPELRRLANVRSRPEGIAVLVDHYDDRDWPALWWVRVRGRGRVVEVGPERDRAQELLRKKYEQYADMPPQGSVLALDVTEWRGWSWGPIE